MEIPDVPDVEGAKDVLRYALEAPETDEEDVLEAIELLNRAVVREELLIFATELGLELPEGN